MPSFITRGSEIIPSQPSINFTYIILFVLTLLPARSLRIESQKGADVDFLNHDEGSAGELEVFGSCCAQALAVSWPFDDETFSALKSYTESVLVLAHGSSLMHT